MENACQGLRFRLAALAAVTCLLTVAWPTTAWAHNKMEGLMIVLGWIFVAGPCALLCGLLLVITLVLNRREETPFIRGYRITALVLSSISLVTCVSTAAVSILADSGAEQDVLIISIPVWLVAMGLSLFSILAARKM